MEETGDPHWLLRRGRITDVGAIHALMGRPPLHRYLTDGVAPDRATIATWLSWSEADFRRSGVGLWLLAREPGKCAGFVWLRVGENRIEAELLYALDERFWGMGLATRMAHSAVNAGFAAGLSRICAGVDLANTGSIAILRRLGMRYLRDVAYPLGPGMEFAIERGASLSGELVDFADD